jgi:hypothetical protein
MLVIGGNAHCLRRLPSQAAGGAPGCGGRDILLVLRNAVTVTDVSVIHPQGVATLTVATGTPGAAAVHRDALKVASYALERTLSCRSRWRLTADRVPLQ